MNPCRGREEELHLLVFGKHGAYQACTMDLNESTTAPILAPSPSFPHYIRPSRSSDQTPPTTSPSFIDPTPTPPNSILLRAIFSLSISREF